MNRRSLLALFAITLLSSSVFLEFGVAVIPVVDPDAPAGPVDAPLEGFAPTVELLGDAVDTPLDALRRGIDDVLAAGRLVFLFFYADWCYYCQLEQPIIDALEATYAKRVLFIRLNEVDHPEAFEAFEVEGFPTSLLIYGRGDGAYVSHVFRGYQAGDALRTGLDAVLRGELPLPDQDAPASEEGGDGSSQCELALGGLFNHQSCNFWECVDECSEDATGELIDAAKSLIWGCVGGDPALVTGCAGALESGEATDILSCLFGILEKIVSGVGGIGCAYDAVAALIKHFTDLGDFGSCLGQCTEDAGSYGQECAPGSERTGCFVGDVWLYRCSSDCEWRRVREVLDCTQCYDCMDYRGYPECVYIAPKDDPECEDVKPEKPKPPSEPGADHPDDNADASTFTGFYNASVATEGLPEVAVLQRGYPWGIRRFLDLMGVPYLPVGVYFVEFLSPQAFPVLIVPSGGLFGLDTSPSIRAALETYVEGGGTVIVFSQQRGTDYAVLPGGEVNGMGWIEDQSCFMRGSGMNVYHPILAGQSPELRGDEAYPTLDLSVDGYFTTYPRDALVLLTRVKTATPSMILYAYGDGRVLASTLYSDYLGFVTWGNRHLAETTLLMDLVSWAQSDPSIPTYAYSTTANLTLAVPFKNPLAYSPAWPRFDRGDVVTLPINVTNPTEDPATTVQFTVLDPYYRYDAVNVSVTIPPNSTRLVELSYPTDPSSDPGVWLVLVTLFSDARELWGAYHGAFTLDLSVDDLSHFTMELVVTRPWPKYSSMVVAHAENVSFTALPSQTRVINTTFTPDTRGIWRLEYRVTVLDDITVQTGAVYFAISSYAENPDGWAYQGADITFKMTTDKEWYFLGENATVTVHLWNNGDHAQNLSVLLGQWYTTRYPTPEVTAQYSSGLYNISNYIAIDTTVAPGGYANFTYVWPIGYGPPEIALFRRADNYHNWWLISVFNRTDSGDYLSLGYVSRGLHYWNTPRISLRSMDLDQEAYQLGDNVTATVQIANWHPLNDALPARLVLTLTDWMDTVVATAERDIAIAPPTVTETPFGTTTEPSTRMETFQLPLADDLWREAEIEGYFRLDTRLYYDNVLIHRPLWSISRRVDNVRLESVYTTRLLLDGKRYAAYTAGQDVHLNYSVTNRLSTLLHIGTVHVTIPALGYDSTAQLDVPPTQRRSLLLSSTLPTDIAAGRHPIYVTLEDVTLPGGVVLQNVTEAYGFTVPESRLQLEQPAAYVNGTIEVRIDNLGGVDTVYAYALNLTSDAGVPPSTQTLHAESGSAPIPANTSTTWRYTIPDATIAASPGRWWGSGYYKIFLLSMELTDTGTGTTRVAKLRFFLRTPSPAELVPRLTASGYAAGDDAQLEIRNAGETATAYAHHVTLVDAHGNQIHAQTGTGSLAAGGATTVTVPIPPDAVDGLYYFTVDLDNQDTGATTRDVVMLSIEGLAAHLESATDEQVYHVDEDVTITTAIDNLNGRIEDATLHLAITGAKPCVIPTDDLIITEDTVLCSGTYTVRDEGYQGVLRITEDNVVLDCNGATLNGVSGGSYSTQMGMGVMSLYNDNVTIKNCNVTEYRYGIYVTGGQHNVVVNNAVRDIYARGIYLGGHQSASNLIVNNTIVDARSGIYVTGGSQNIIAENNITGGTNGIYLYGEEDSIIYKNTVTDPSYGIQLTCSSRRNVILENNVTESGTAGIALSTIGTSCTMGGDDNIVYNNTVTFSRDGITVRRSENNTIAYNLVHSNTGHGVYIQSGSTFDFSLPGTILYPSYSNRVVNNTITSNTWYGIYLYGFSNNTQILNNVLTNNRYGIYANYWCAAGTGCPPHSNNIIASNSIHNNTDYGIYVNGRANHNLIVDNVVTLHDSYYGIYLPSLGNANTVVNNTASENWIGIYVSGANNTLYHNNLIDNTQTQAVDTGTDNSWNSSYPTGGNFWSDYAGVDAFSGPYQTLSGSDGIGDAPYTFPQSAQDPYPFMNPNGWPVFEVPDSPLIALPEPPSYSIPTTNVPPASNGSGVIWQHDVSVDVVDAWTEHTVVGPIGAPGRFYLTATLYASTGQRIAWDAAAFYVTDAPLHLVMRTDRDAYRPNEPITVSGDVWNTGDTPRDVTLTLTKNATAICTESFTLPANATRAYQCTTAANATFTLHGTVDGFAAYTDIPILAPRVEATFTVPDLVGRDPFTATLELRNAGTTSVNLHIAIGEHDTSVTVPLAQTRTVQTTLTITANTTVTATLSGDYEATLVRAVAFGERIAILLHPRDFYLAGPVDVPFTVVNLGRLATRVDVTFTAAETLVQRSMFLPVAGNITDVVTFDLEQGAHVLRYATPFQTGNVTLRVATPPEFIVTGLPENMTVHLDERVVLPLTVANVGGTAGEADVALTVPGMTQQANRTVIAPGREGRVDFAFRVPDDLEAASYTAIFTLDDAAHAVPFRVQGYKIAVNATLDQPLYEDGKNATLTVTVTNLRDLNASLFARVQLGDYDVTRYFNLSALATEVLVFSVPVDFTAGKLSYTVYLTSGRALHINAVYLHPRPPASAGIALTMDRQVYAIGDTVTVSVNTTRPGRLVLTAPNMAFNDTVPQGLTAFEFQLPVLKSGTYLIGYDFDGYQATYPIDVVGYAARVVDSTIDQRDNAVVTVTLHIDVNRAFDGVVQVYLYDPDDEIIGETPVNRTFTLGENVVTASVPLTTTQTGAHAVVYEIYAYGSTIFLASGARYFDATYTDDVPPSITHLPVTRGVEGTAIPVAALVTDNVAVVEVALYYRHVVTTGYTRLPMPPCAACIDTYNATIPAAAVTADLEYYLNASDGAHVALHGTPATPHRITVDRAPAAVTLSPATGIAHNALTLAWTASGAADFANYTVYQSTTHGVLGTAVTTITDGTTTTYAVTGLAPSTTYHFTVRVTDTDGLSADSAQVTATTTAAPPPAEVPWLYVGIALVAVAAVAVLLLVSRRGF